MNPPFRASRTYSAAGLLAVSLFLAGCSPTYVMRAGWAQMKILQARTPVEQVLVDPAVDRETRDKLTLALEARRFVRDSLRLDVGRSYTTYVRLESDTLALVLSAAHRDRFESVTWWFPIVGRVPYRGYFSESQALEEQERLEARGFDTWLRPTAAFSTLGWFSDPILSSMVRADHVGLVETLIHEVSHSHLFLPGQVRFNESFATWVGHVGAIQFFCTRDGGGPDTVWCRRAQDRWADAIDFSRYLDGLVDDLQNLFGEDQLPQVEMLAQRDTLLQGALTRFRQDVQPNFRASTFEGFAATPLNNATLLARMLYYHRLPDFQGLLDAHDGNLTQAVNYLAEAGPDAQDPFQLLPPAPPAS